MAVSMTGPRLPQDVIEAPSVNSESDRTDTAGIWGSQGLACLTRDREVTGSNVAAAGDRVAGANSAFHFTVVDKRVPALAGKAKAGMTIH